MWLARCPSAGCVELSSDHDHYLCDRFGAGRGLPASHPVALEARLCAPRDSYVPTASPLPFLGEERPASGLSAPRHGHGPRMDAVPATADADVPDASRMCSHRSPSSAPWVGGRVLRVFSDPMAVMSRVHHAGSGR
jgi:hypothetical protein